MVEEIVDVGVVIPQDRLPKLVIDSIMDLPAPQLLEEIRPARADDPAVTLSVCVS